MPGADGDEKSETRSAVQSDMTNHNPHWFDPTKDERFAPPPMHTAKGSSSSSSSPPVSMKEFRGEFSSANRRKKLIATASILALLVAVGAIVAGVMLSRSSTAPIESSSKVTGIPPIKPIFSGDGYPGAEEVEYEAEVKEEVVEEERDKEDDGVGEGGEGGHTNLPDKGEIKE